MSPEPLKTREGSNADAGVKADMDPVAAAGRPASTRGPRSGGTSALLVGTTRTCHKATGIQIMKSR
jgi:hypothetical protein